MYSHIYTRKEIVVLQKKDLKKKCLKLTLKIIRLAVHEDVVDYNHTEDAGPQMQVTEQQHKSHILCKAEVVFDHRKL